MSSAFENSFNYFISSGGYDCYSDHIDGVRHRYINHAVAGKIMKQAFQEKSMIFD